MQTPQPTLLLVDDDVGYTRLVTKHLQRTGNKQEIVIFHDGQAALEYLFTEPTALEAPRPLPQVLLLDLHVSGCSGTDILARLRANARTKHLLIVIMSSSDDPEDIEECYARGCNLYLTKPVDAGALREAIVTLARVFSLIQLPTGLRSQERYRMIPSRPPPTLEPVNQRIRML